MTLEAEYRERVCSAVSQEETDTEWIRYLQLKYATDGTLDIFQALQQKPRLNGAISVYRYMDGRLTEREFYQVIRSDTLDLYAQSLIDQGIAVVKFDATYEEIVNRSVLAGLKQFDELKTGDVRSGQGLADTCTACAVLWYKFVEALHARCKLLTVRELEGKIAIQSGEEKAILDGNDFTGLELTPEEKTEYEYLTGIRAAVDKEA